MLAFGPYPISIQRRVRGPRGHLSNEQSALLLRKILGHGPAPALVVAAHRSLKNNTRELVEAALQPVIPRGTDFVHAEPIGAPTIHLPMARPPSVRKPEQLSLLTVDVGLSTLSP
jgi:phosphoribosyl 1,2-cyclic phosphodiesterase